MADDGNTSDSSDAGSARAEAERSGPSRRQFLAAGTTASLVALAGCSGGDGSTPTDSDGGGGDQATATGTATETEDYPDEVVIGSIHPFSGSTSYVGKRLHNAIDLAATLKNENGGIESMDGAEVRVVRGDHKNDPTVGGEAAQDLLDDGADVLTGTYSSPTASSVSRVAESQQVPFVIDIGVAASILQERNLEYVYRAQPNSWSQAADHIEGLEAVADQANLELNTLGLYHVDTTYGQAIRDGLQRAVEDTDMEIVAETTIGFGETADTQVTQLREADPDVLVPTAFTNQMLGLVSAMKNQDYWPEVFAACASGGMNQETFQEMGDIINGALTEGYALDPNSDRVDQINQRFMDTYDTASMTANVSMAFTTGEVLIEAFEQAGTADPETLNQTLEEIEVDNHTMAMPPISFDEDGENANPLSVTSQVQEMETEIVYPSEYSEADINTATIGGN